MKGGLKTREATIASRKLVIKETISDIDYLKNTVNPNTNAVDASALLWKETKKPTVIDPTSGIFTFNDVVFGLEVCLDHASQRLVKLGESYPGLVNSVQVQLIPSCGMTVQDPSVVIRPNKSTVVFGVDGLQYFNGNKFNSKGANSEVFIYTDSVKTQITRRPEFSWPVFPGDWKTYKNDRYAYNELFSTSTWIKYPPRLVVYPAQAIPEK